MHVEAIREWKRIFVEFLFVCLYLQCCWKSKYERGLDSMNMFNSNGVLCMSQAKTWIFTIFSVLNGAMSELVVRLYTITIYIFIYMYFREKYVSYRNAFNIA